MPSQMDVVIITRNTALFAQRMVSFAPFVVGVSILLGGPRRFEGPSFLVVNQFMPWWFWGSIFTFFGLWMLWGTRGFRRIFWPAFIGGCFFGFWALLLFVAAYLTRHHAIPAALLPGAAYGYLGIQLVAVAARDIHRPRFFRFFQGKWQRRHHQ